VSIKAGQILHDAHGFVVDRIQTGGVGNLNIPEEKIYELGNFSTVATVRDIPDLTFDMESLDVSTEIEALVTGVDPTAVVDGDEFDYLDAKPLYVISPFKAGQGLFNIVRGLVIPHLTLENVTYRFGVRANATQSFSLRCDSIYYVPGTPYYEEFTGDGSTATFNLAHTAILYEEGADDIYVLGLCAEYTDGTYRRLFFGEDYTNTATSFTLLDPAGDTPAGTVIRCVYGSATSTNYPQTVHQGVSVKPAAVRGKDIDVYVGTSDATPTFSRWTGVQSFEVSRRVNLDNDEEFGNTHFVAQDYDTAEVSGSVTVRPRDPADLWDKIHQVADVATNRVVGPLTSVFLPVEIRISDPDTGDRVKTLYIPDARFTVPGIQGRVQQKTEVTFNFSSDGGTLLVYSGNRTGT
jgi:hypothetical protein